MLPLPLLSQILLFTASVIAGWTDASRRRIPNWLCAATAIAGLVMTVIRGGAEGLGSHALHAFIALAAGVVLFKVGAFGGGDAKFYAAVATWFPLGKGAALLMSVALCGLLLLIVWFAYRRAARKQLRRTSSDLSDSLPYGIAIGAGAVVATILNG